LIPTEQLVKFDYVRDVLGQPEALEQTRQSIESMPPPLDLAAGLEAGRFKRVVLTGMGASLHALYPLHLRLTGHGVSSLLADAAELIHYMPSLLGPECLLIAVSQSGRSAEIVRLLEMARGKLAVIGVTNSPTSPLARDSDFAVLTRAGEESTVSCKTYVASLAVLEWLGGALLRADLSPLSDALENAVQSTRDYLARWKAHVDFLTQFLSGMNHMFLVGRGRSLAAAGAGGLILKEAAHFHAEGMGSAAFRHGPLEMVGPDVAVCVFAGDDRTAALNRSLAADVSRSGGKAAWIGEDGVTDTFRIAATSPESRTIMEILPVQMISLALAARSGHEPGVFQHLGKVTTVE
jgi:glucosamine--fructose-6-phosphate aminotransferase (isomerizing)